jgi:hypothetical protein
VGKMNQELIDNIKQKVEEHTARPKTFPEQYITFDSDDRGRLNMSICYDLTFLPKEKQLFIIKFAIDSLKEYAINKNLLG